MLPSYSEATDSRIVLQSPSTEIPALLGESSLVLLQLKRSLGWKRHLWIRMEIESCEPALLISIDSLSVVDKESTKIITEANGVDLSSLNKSSLRKGALVPIGVGRSVDSNTFKVIKCSFCNSKGSNPCTSCLSKGTIPCTGCMSNSSSKAEDTPLCLLCYGTGRVKCRECSGIGRTKCSQCNGNGNRQSFVQKVIERSEKPSNITLVFLVGSGDLQWRIPNLKGIQRDCGHCLYDRTNLTGPVPIPLIHDMVSTLPAGSSTINTAPIMDAMCTPVNTIAQRLSIHQQNVYMIRIKGRLCKRRALVMVHAKDSLLSVLHFEETMLDWLVSFIIPSSGALICLNFIGYHLLKKLRD